MGAGELGRRGALLQVPDGLLVKVLRVAVVGEQRPGPGEQPERQLGSGRERPVGEPRDSRMRQLGLAASRGRLD